MMNRQKPCNRLQIPFNRRREPRHFWYYIEILCEIMKNKFTYRQPNNRIPTEISRLYKSSRRLASLCLPSVGPLRQPCLPKEHVSFIRLYHSGHIPSHHPLPLASVAIVPGLRYTLFPSRKRARVVEWTGLENQRRGNLSVSSNLTASATLPLAPTSTGARPPQPEWWNR